MNATDPSGLAETGGYWYNLFNGNLWRDSSAVGTITVSGGGGGTYAVKGYVFCGPIEFVDTDPHSVAIYDADDLGQATTYEGYRRTMLLTAGRDQMQDAAEHYATETRDVVSIHHPSAKVKRSVLAQALDSVKRKKNRINSINRLYILDHGYKSGEQELGDKEIDANAPEWRQLCSQVEPDGYVYLMGCHVGSNDTLLKEYASKGGRSVVAPTKKTIYLPGGGVITFGRWVVMSPAGDKTVYNTWGPPALP